jgi:hypothetical protein
MQAGPVAVVKASRCRTTELLFRYPGKQTWILFDLVITEFCSVFLCHDDNIKSFFQITGTEFRFP